MSRTQNLCLRQMLSARTNGETFVSATMCLRLSGPLGCTLIRSLLSRACDIKRESSSKFVRFKDKYHHFYIPGINLVPELLGPDTATFWYSDNDILSWLLLDSGICFGWKTCVLSETGFIQKLLLVSFNKWSSPNSFPQLVSTIKEVDKFTVSQ